MRTYRLLGTPQTSVSHCSCIRNGGSFCVSSSLLSSSTLSTTATPEGLTAEISLALSDPSLTSTERNAQDDVEGPIPIVKLVKSMFFSNLNVFVCIPDRPRSCLDLYAITEEAFLQGNHSVSSAKQVINLSAYSFLSPFLEAMCHISALFHIQGTQILLEVHTPRYMLL